MNVKFLLFSKDGQGTENGVRNTWFYREAGINMVVRTQLYANSARLKMSGNIQGKQDQNIYNN